MMDGLRLISHDGTEEARGAMGVCVCVCITITAFPRRP